MFHYASRLSICGAVFNRGLLVPHKDATKSDMALVEVRWRPSGGRGEYEFVPSDAFLGRQIVIDVPSVDGGYVETDVKGYLRDGKPRLRRDRPNDRSMLNVPPLVAALAWLPAPRREDKGYLKLPLAEKEYVAASIAFDVKISGNVAFARAIELKVLHYEYAIDLSSRMKRIGRVLDQLGGSAAQAYANEYIALVQGHLPSARFAEISELLRGYLLLHPEVDAALDDEDPELSFSAPATETSRLDVAALSAEETKRRLVAHYRIDRSRKIRDAKIKAHIADHGRVYCENCSFDFAKAYPKIGDGFIEVHHKKQLALLMPNEKTFIADLMLLCANCHRMVHRKRPPHTPEFLAAHTLAKYL